MVLVGDATPMLCYDDGSITDPEALQSMDGAGYLAYGYQYNYQPQMLLEKEALLGNHPWAIPMAGVLGDVPGNATAFATDGAVSSSTSQSSELTFDGHGEGYCAPWIDATDQFSYGLAPRHPAGSATPDCFSFGGSNSMAAEASQKRPRAHAPSQQLGAEQETITTPKKQCGGDRRATKPAKTPTVTPTTEPQSLAAKNRRERISERLRALQELVPNGGKVDMVTMLDKAITYVKFMQLQIKVLETDAFWPSHGGKAPEMCQVKEALDAILVSSSLSQPNISRLN
ncbi:putative transcription factor bHLH086 [Phragmites australis]|uniref:putative transcription factor bHLH086 n=1 Tax=Phragmites australis TaxID=29695 RepID=UPI002D788EEF|nr:putative transcription factor bHLH086 [Phragmites australis]